ncbi:diguanylate cyclase (GGDEF) domain-containing protein [Andreprevotia lacus DSM 23236]|jgi:diguanylate cyclase (GGDEF)-like protein|uniref:diguanylate cyclase n=1 Tax=Andreprevotia lacus DSM 23236 TaxID=1121001 RepID=A0A1W1XRM0_9NEIS|nr:GGDEF domain-containing protein [Andreprevotia lacus]SMC26603.1 diguanylate cyclase (GGDEF) domain-containing protein [Andreprevotia lacus DSM 23236]
MGGDDNWMAIAWGVAALGWLAALALGLSWQRARQRAAQAANEYVDALTGLPTRAAFLENAGREVNRSQRAGHVLSALLVDVDQMRKLNERYGTQGGDLVLQYVAECCRGSVRDFDLIGRFSSEEIALLLPDTPLDGAQTVADRIRLRVMTTPVKLEDGREIKVGVTVGAAAISDETDTLEDLLLAADAACGVVHTDD